MPALGVDFVQLGIGIRKLAQFKIALRGHQRTEIIGFERHTMADPPKSRATRKASFPLSPEFLHLESEVPSISAGAAACARCSEPGSPCVPDLASLKTKLGLILSGWRSGAIPSSIKPPPKATRPADSPSKNARAQRPGDFRIRASWMISVKPGFRVGNPSFRDQSGRLGKLPTIRTALPLQSLPPEL